MPEQVPNMTPRDDSAQVDPEGFPAPPPDDEGAHSPGDEELWNESWYFDAVSEDGSLGLYARLGLYPNLGVAWYTAYVTGPDRPTVAVVDLEAPLPEGDGLSTETGSLRADHRCARPLERFEISLDGAGQAHEDHSAPLRAQDGDPVEVGFEAVWETDGEPYAYRMTTRYEIPCRVSGTVRVGDEKLELRGPGQRDHSWGLRDWWAMNWMWSAGRLEDGTRVHAVHMRLPGRDFGVGYVQDAGGPRELETVEATERLRDDGLVESAHVQTSPGGLVFESESLAHGPLRLVARDGRATSFPRAMCRLRADDGRSGLGWMEWNLNQGPRA